MCTAIEKVAQYNREYRARIKAEKKKVVHQATEDEMVAMCDKWLETNDATQLSDEGGYSQPSPVYIKSGMGGSFL